MKCINCFRPTERINCHEMSETGIDFVIMFSASVVFCCRSAHIRCFSFLAFLEGTPEAHFFFLHKGIFHLPGLVFWCSFASSRSLPKMGADVEITFFSVFYSMSTMTTSRLSLVQPITAHQPTAADIFYFFA